MNQATSHLPFDFSIVIPAYQEAKRIGKTLDELASFLKKDAYFASKKVEVLVVAADAPDNTQSIVLRKQKLFKYLTLLTPGPKVGKGRDVQYGMLQAKGKAVLFMDADLATPLHHLQPFYEAYLEGAEVVVATRNLRRHHPGLRRRFLSNAGNILFRVAGGVWVEDSQCGFKLFSHRAAQLCFGRLHILGWGFDMEVLTIARSNKLRIATQRVNDWISVPEGTFVGGSMANALKSLVELGVIAWRRITGVYRATPTELENE